MIPQPGTWTADPAHFGHYETGGLARWFRDRYYPNQTLATPSAAGATNDTKVGGGFIANALLIWRLPFRLSDIRAGGRRRPRRGLPAGRRPDRGQQCPHR